MHFEALEDWLSWQENLHAKAIDLGLERVTRVFQSLNPEQTKPVTIIVGGTNGKGSCIAFLESIYRAAGYRVGTYTSPHILNYNERIKVAGKPVADQTICEAFERIETVRDDVSLSYFEFGTLAALDIFWRSNLDIQLLEVGLGGRLDAVNIIDADVAIVTTICIDHTDWLGETREAIGKEKSGIFRPDVPAIIGDPEPPASLIDNALEMKAKVFAVGKEFNYQKTETTWHWLLNDQIIFEELPKPALIGEQQYRNASTAIMAIELLQEKLSVKAPNIAQGLMNAHLMGRFQLINAEIPVLLDVGHNPQAVRMLAAGLERYFPNQRIHAIFAMMKDKDIGGVVKIMQPYISNWYIAPLDHSRIAEHSVIAEVLKKQKIKNLAYGFTDFTETFNKALENARQGDLILIFGSFFLVSAYFSAFSK
jgi:dihydrofolate synthase/folylpolyglutamate synthase